MYTYIYIYIWNINAVALNSCSPEATQIQRFDLYFHTHRRAGNCQCLRNIVSFTKQVQNRAHTCIYG